MLMRMGFRIVQFADGMEDTQPNAEVVPTVSGSISVYVARRA